ncbi:MAG TPA: MarR family transcriptional regulator [Gemmatimonadales bacterium]|jgi:DNA-binding MarR family transcriptional regulator|nr:MarR family transcriptional regulator [Gemmatimonadales bacterium]
MTPRARAVADRLHSAAIHLLRRVRRHDAALGVGPAALSALSVLVFGGPRSLSRLAAAEQVRLPTMSRIVAGLERAGLARREPDPTDRRAFVIHPTPRGRATVRRGRRRRVAALAALLAPLDHRRLAELEGAAACVEALLEEGRD